LSVAAFLRRAGGSMLESTGSHGRGVVISEVYLIVYTFKADENNCAGVSI